MTLLLSVLVFGVYSAALLAIGAVGFTLQFGVTNVLNLAYGSILTACIFVEYYVTGHSTNSGLAMLVGGAAGAVLSLLVGHVIVGAFMRRGAGGFGIAMVTIGLGLMIQFTLEAIQGPFILAYVVEQQPQRAEHLRRRPRLAAGHDDRASPSLAMVAVHLLLRSDQARPRDAGDRR